MNKSLPIGVFDSGIGGISVLNQCRAILPHESYIYFGDDANCPYGERPTEEIAALTEKAADKLVCMGIKALIIACNTATGAAVERLREKYDFPVIGMEPALKPAVLAADGGRVLVMATPATLHQQKFANLLAKYDQTNIDTLPCAGLAELIEYSLDDKALLTAYLKNTLPENTDAYSAVVLGCTHYTFIEELIAEFFPNAKIYHGNTGAANQLKRILENSDMLNPDGGELSIYISSGNEQVLELCGKLLDK